MAQNHIQISFDLSLNQLYNIIQCGVMELDVQKLFSEGAREVIFCEGAHSSSSLLRVVNENKNAAIQWKFKNEVYPPPLLPPHRWSRIPAHTLLRWSV